MPVTHPVYQRMLLKLSGEALMGGGSFGLDPEILARLAGEIRGLVARGVELALVIGGGNLFRGAELSAAGMDRVTGDHMGMLATVMNALAMQDTILRQGGRATVMSAFPIGTLCRTFDRREACERLAAGEVVLFAAGTGNPFFTTDSAASLRAVEIAAAVLVKATKVDGVYSADPMKHPDAVFYPRLTHEQALREGLGVMDATAIVLCRDHRLPVRVTNIYTAGALLRLAEGEDIGSLVISEPGDERGSK